MSRVWARVALIVSGVALIAATGVGVASADSGGCVTNRIKFRAENSTATLTTYGPFVVIPSTSVSFTIGGAVPTCLKVEFTAVVYHTDYLLFIAQLDGSGCGAPCTVTHGPDPNYHTVAFNWAFNNVVPGAHTLRVLWSTSSGTTTINTRSVFVHYFQ